MRNPNLSSLFFISIILQKERILKTGKAISLMLYCISLKKKGGGIALEKEWILMVQQQNQLGSLMKTNQKTAKFGLVMSEQEAALILQERKNALQDRKELSLGRGLLKKSSMSFVILIILSKIII